jgi:hypothetical protein
MPGPQAIRVLMGCYLIGRLQKPHAQLAGMVPQKLAETNNYPSLHMPGYDFLNIFGFFISNDHAKNPE